MKREKETLPTVCPERYCKTIGHGMKRKELTGWVTFADVLQKCPRLHFHLLTVYSVVNEKKLVSRSCFSKPAIWAWKNIWEAQDWVLTGSIVVAVIFTDLPPSSV